MLAARLSREIFTVSLPGLLPFAIRYDQRVRIRKRHMPELPPEFHRSTLSFPLGERAAYRDASVTDTLQLRDFGDHWILQLDRHNPEKGVVPFVKHALTDALPVTLGIAAAIGVIVAVAGSR